MKFDVNKLSKVKKDIIDSMIRHTVPSMIEELKKRDIMDLYRMLPTKSINLQSICLKSIRDASDGRMIILIAHLHIENFMEEILKRKLRNPDQLINFGFHQKLSFLNALGLIEGGLHEDIKQINTLRNKFAHNLYMTDDKMDMSKFTRLKNIYRIKNYKKPKDLAEFNRLILKLQLLLTTSEIFDKFDWLNYIRR